MTKRIDLSTFAAAAAGMRRPFHEKYYAMYSSVLGGIVTDPVLMTLPLDDHIVHRGDGVFEAFKCVEGGIYNMGAHLARLEHSAHALDMKGFPGAERIERLVVETVEAGGRADCAIRVFVSRGPGGFGVNPYESAGSELYISASRLGRPFMAEHPDGARVRTSRFPAKPGFFASIKSCNYLTNVLMKKEAVDGGVDFTIAFDERGCMAEGATENAGIVTARRELLFPHLGGILQGTTMMRVMELAGQLVASGELARAAFEDIDGAAVREATEMLLVGTTINVAAVREFDGRAVRRGAPGPVARRLDALLEEDILRNPRLRTPVAIAAAEPRPA